MSRPVGPGGAGSGAAAGWVVPAVGAVLLLASAATWMAGTLTAWQQNTAAGRAPFHLLLVVQAGRDGTQSLWPGTSPTSVWTLTGVLVVLVSAPVLAAVLRWAVRRPRADDPGRSLARLRDVAHLTMPAAAVTARRLRPSLAGRKPAELAAGDVGLALGRLRGSGGGCGKAGRVLYSSWEDVVLAYMAPRSGKSTALAIPAVLSAPGAAIATIHIAIENILRAPGLSRSRSRCHAPTAPTTSEVVR